MVDVYGFHVVKYTSLMDCLKVYIPFCSLGRICSLEAISFNDKKVSHTSLIWCIHIYIYTYKWIKWYTQNSNNGLNIRDYLILSCMHKSNNMKHKIHIQKNIYIYFFIKKTNILEPSYISCNSSQYTLRTHWVTDLRQFRRFVTTSDFWKDDDTRDRCV